MTLDGASDAAVRNPPIRKQPTGSQAPIFPRSPGYREALSPRSSVNSTPGILLTVDAPDPLASCEEVAVHASGLQRTPSHGRMRRNASNGRLGASHGYCGGNVGRSQSMRTAKRPQSLDPTHRFRQRIASIPNDLIMPGEGGGAERIASNHSLPLPGDESEILRLRNFCVTSKGVVNRGDSFRSKSRSNHSLASNGSNGASRSQQCPAVVTSEPLPRKDPAVGARPEIVPAEEPAEECAQASAPEPVKYRVLVVGGPDVGKSSLVEQFTTSEYICAYDSSLDEENEKSITVVLNGEESELAFIEHSVIGEPPQNFVEMYNPDAYVLIYSVVSKRSFQKSKEILGLLEKWDNVDNKAVILVGNKTDLVRLRVISTDDGRALATSAGTKFIETSSGINHHVDELLAGILSQIRLKTEHIEKMKKKRESVSAGKARGRCTGFAGCKAKGIIKRILKKACTRSKSCDNLHVL
ncbi:GTP-binding protein REM 1-like [Centruroides sculpturatus]|uniref:GTP-binding protein REM 1-like n=1 Tax=Centruroides sculpturatus TaxID=218467 RepID=UPI000C6E17FE|nr:GTP-binding protein REM 1-like [Centruroides sculpturatus]